MRMVKLAAMIMLLAAAAPAHAESQLGVLASPSIAAGKISESNGGSTAVLALQGEVGYRVGKRFMLGVHLGAATASDEVIAVELMSGEIIMRTVSYRPLDMGVSALVELHRAVFVTGWFGGQRTWSRVDSSDWELLDGTSPVFGVSVGVDVLERDAHRLSVGASFERTLETDRRPFNYTVVGIGAVYRWWAP